MPTFAIANPANPADRAASTARGAPAVGVTRLATEPPLTEAEVIAAATRMQLADRSGGGVRLLQRLMDPALTLDVLAPLLAAEPGLAIRVLRVANAPYYGQAGNVATLARATQVLGLNALRGIAAAACFDGVTAAARPAHGPDLRSFKRHSLACGVAAQALAQRVEPALAEQAFMAGLLHDLGLLLLWRLRPATMAAHVSSLRGTRPASAAPVRGIGHAHCGRLLMQAWALPTMLTEAIATHEEFADEAAAAPGLNGLLRVGHVLAIEAGFVLADEAVAPWPAPPAVPAEWQQACAEMAAGLPEEIERLAAAFSD